MPKKRRTISGIFNPEEVEAIDKTLETLGINQNQMVKEAVSFWMMVRPTITLLESTNFGKLMKSASRKIKKTKSIDEKQFESLFRNYVRKYGESELDEINTKLEEADKNYHTIKRKKKRGAPKKPKKRGRPKR